MLVIWNICEDLLISLHNAIVEGVLFEGDGEDGGVCLVGMLARSFEFYGKHIVQVPDVFPHMWLFACRIDVCIGMDLLRMGL